MRRMSVKLAADQCSDASGVPCSFERNESDTEVSFVCSACRKDSHTPDPAEGMEQFNLHKCEPKRKRADG
jgi:hypothetical protein